MKMLNSIFQVLYRLMQLLNLEKIHIIRSEKKINEKDPFIGLCFSVIMFIAGIFALKTGDVIGLILGVGSLSFSFLMLKMSVEFWERVHHVK